MHINREVYLSLYKTEANSVMFFVIVNNVRIASHTPRLKNAKILTIKLKYSQILKQ